MKAASEVLGAMIDKIITPKQPKDWVWEVWQRILSDHEPIASPKVLARLKELRRDWRASYEGANIKFTEAEANKAWKQQLVDQSKQARVGKLHEVRTRSEESLTGEFLSKQLACKEAMAADVKEGATLTRPVVLAALAHADKFIAERTATEKAEAEAHGLEFFPSPLLAAAISVVSKERAWLQDGRRCFVRTLNPFFILE